MPKSGLDINVYVPDCANCPLKSVCNDQKNKKEEKVDKDIALVKLFESLNKAMKKAGGMPMTANRAESMTLIEFLKLIAPNGIGFQYGNKEQATLDEVLKAVEHIRKNYTDPDMTDRQRRDEMDNLIRNLKLIMKG